MLGGFIKFVLIILSPAIILIAGMIISFLFSFYLRKRVTS